MSRKNDGTRPGKSVAVARDSAFDKPNLNGDWSNLFLLIFLYSIQAMPISFCAALPILLQSENNVSYADQALLSIVMWPFSMKLLMAPVVDSLYCQRIGRRKSWLLPVQYLIGALLIYFAVNADDWLPESGRPNLEMIVIVLFVNNILIAIQDIVVDSWALTMLKKNNVSYASTCSTTGMSVGTLIGFVCPVLLSSEKFCNANLRLTPDKGGMISIKSFLLFWGIIFSLSSTLIAIFKKEKNAELEDNNISITILQTYKILWDITKIKHMKTLLLAVVTSWIGFIASENVANLKLIDAGVSKDNITLVNSFLIVLKIALPLVISKYTTGPKPMSLYLKMTPIRLLWILVYVALIYFTPYLLKNNGVLGVNYYVLLVFISAINEILFTTLFTCLIAFFARISDPLFGGTYITLLNTARSVGWTVPSSCLLKLIDVFTVKRCTNDIQNVTVSYSINQSKLNGCAVVIDGYYVEVVLCLVVGFIWYGVFKSHLKDLQSKDPSHWLIKSIPHVTRDV